MSKEKKALMIDYDAKQLAKDTAHHLEPIIFEIVESIEQKKQNEFEKDLTLQESADYLNISRVTFSKLIQKGEIPFVSMNPDNPKAKKLFSRKDLNDWKTLKKTKTIEELRKQSRNG